VSFDRTFVYKECAIEEILSIIFVILNIPNILLGLVGRFLGDVLKQILKIK